MPPEIVPHGGFSFSKETPIAAGTLRFTSYINATLLSEYENSESLYNLGTLNYEQVYAWLSCAMQEGTAASASAGLKETATRKDAFDFWQNQLTHSAQGSQEAVNKVMALPLVYAALSPVENTSLNTLLQKIGGSDGLGTGLGILWWNATEWGVPALLMTIPTGIIVIEVVRLTQEIIRSVARGAGPEVEQLAANWVRSRVVSAQQRTYLRIEPTVDEDLLLNNRNEDKRSR